MNFLPNSVTDRSIEHSEEASIAKISTEEMNQEFDEFINRPLLTSTSRTFKVSLNETLKSVHFHLSISKSLHVKIPVEKESQEKQLY